MPKSKKPEKTIDFIAADMKRVAKKLKINPAIMTKAQYFSKGEGKISEWDIRKFGGYLSIRNAYFEFEDEGRDEASYTEVNDLKRAFRKLRKDSGKMDLLLNRITEAVSAMPKVKVKPYKVKSKAKSKKEPRTVTVVLSDLHFGSDITKEEHGYDWGRLEEARALAAVVKNVCNYKLQYRDQTEVVVNILGDIIENELHGSNSTDYLHLQTCRAMWLLSQAIARLSENFPKVRVNFAVGNHGRDTSIHHSRATDMKFNALETTIYYGVKLACSSLSNVDFFQPKTAWVAYKAQGHNFYATHGDTHLNPGNPGNKIDIKGLENQINKINAALDDKEEYAVFMVGHVHHALATPMPNGTTLLVNGALVPPNSYAQTLNIMESQQIQLLFETTKDYAVGDLRFINVTDPGNSKELDEIIKPFEGLDHL